MSNNTRPRKAAKPASKPDVHALLGQARPAERSIQVCLRGDLRAEWDDLKAQLDQSGGESLGGRLTDGAGRRRIAEQMVDLEEQMRAATVEFRIRALPRRRTTGMPPEQVVWHELINAHPARRDDKNEIIPVDRMGVNADTFFDVLIRASVVDPVLSEDEWTRLLDEILSDRQFDELASAAWGVNRSDVSVPFSSIASRILSTGSELRPPNG